MGEQVVAGFYGGVAQLGEHLPCKQGVKSSNLSVSIRAQECLELYLEKFTQKKEKTLREKLKETSKDPRRKTRTNCRLQGSQKAEGGSRPWETMGKLIYNAI